MLANKLFFVAVCAFGAEYRPAAAGATLDSFVLTVDGPRVSFVEQKGGGPVREFRHPVTGAIGGWDAVMPTAEAETVLGHEYRRVRSQDVALPVAAGTGYLQPWYTGHVETNADLCYSTRANSGGIYETRGLTGSCMSGRSTVAWKEIR